MINHPLLDYLMMLMLALTLWAIAMLFLAGCVKIVRDAQPGSCAKSESHLLVYCRETVPEHTKEVP